MVSANHDALLTGYPSEIQDLVDRLRGILHATVADLEERVNLGWRSISFRDLEGGYVFGVFPFEERVHLLFEHGHRLADPDRILRGQGKRQVRYLELGPRHDLDESMIRRLITAAVHEARLRRALAAGSSKRRRR